MNEWKRVVAVKGALSRAVQEALDYLKTFRDRRNETINTAIPLNMEN